MAKDATDAAGLRFQPAGSHFLAMPQYYKNVVAVPISSLNEGFGPALEAAMAGKLVISTGGGGFPDIAAGGAGILAPTDADEYKSFAINELIYYKNNPDTYVKACRKIQESSKRFDWDCVVDDWIRLIERAKSLALQA